MTDWKAPPRDGRKMWLNRSMELQLLLACNWSCVACDQGSQFTRFDWVKTGTMTLEQIEAFCLEMERHNAYLGRVRVMGGEPTVHRQFHAVIDLLRDKLVDRGYLGRVEVISNGSKPEALREARNQGAVVRVSGESAKQASHVANLVSTPESLGYRGKVCSAPWHCGFSLNRWGYFPCSSGAGIARFEDWMRWQRLTLPTCREPRGAVRENWPDLNDLCDRCYHGLRDEDKQRCGTSDPERNKPGAHISDKLKAWHDGKKANWPIYTGRNGGDK